MITENNGFHGFDKIYIENKVKDHPNTAKILSNITDKPAATYIDDVQVLIKELPDKSDPEKRASTLLLSGIKGGILKKCPGSHGHICCNYHVIDLYMGCPLGCSYCILQSYLNRPFTVINVDIEKIFSRMKAIFENDPGKFYRVGTGELGDSLVFDGLTGFSGDFVRFFGGHKNAMFEFKTKTDNIDNLLEVDHAGNIIAGFSVNPQEVIDSEEKNAASLNNRLSAAKRLSEKGYKIAFHFDPIFHIDDFEKKYGELTDAIFDHIPGSSIAYVSLGTFRYTPDLKSSVESNQNISKILYDEFVECADKKYRYFRPLRISLYKAVIGKLKKYDDKARVYLCMESPEVWKDTIGGEPYPEKSMDLIFRNAIM